MSQSSQMGRHRQHGPQPSQALEATCSAASASNSSAVAAVTSCLQEVITCTTSSQQLVGVLSQPVLTATPPAANTPDLEKALASPSQRPPPLQPPAPAPTQAAGAQSDANHLSTSSPSHQKQQQQQQQQRQQMLTIANPHQQDTRTHVVAELFDTERSYVESLQILIEKYMRPLKAQALIDSQLVDEIFFTIPELMQHHTIFLNALQERLASDWDSSQVIGNVFIEAFTSQQILDTYTKFINNWKNARQAIKVANQTKPAFKGFLESTSREHKNKLTLDALLIMPVQRIPRYELLIKELIKHTPADHPDHMPLVEAQRKIHELALKIDRAEKEMVHQEQLRELEALIENHSGLIQQPQRDFIRYDLVTIASSTLTVTKKERVLFLFCDLLIITSVKKKVSRRSNLQAAFANSDHDITLLEGNKFKLILRVSLDQVDIRCDNNEQTQLWQQQQQQHELELLELAKERQLLEDRCRRLEGDLLVLHQIELLVDKLTSVDRAQLAANLAQTTGETLNQIQILEAQRVECESNFMLQQQEQQQQQKQLQLQDQLPPAHIGPNSHHGAQAADSEAASTNEQQQDQQQHYASKQLDPTLEFVISQEVSLRDLLKMNSNASSKDEGQLESLPQGVGASSALGGASSSISSLTQNKSDSQLACGQNMTYESLVVSFPSFDRRQAFIEAFLEAKRERLKQQQRRLFLVQHPDQQLLKSRSVASDLRRRAKLQHQDEIGHQDRSLSNLSAAAAVAAASRQQQQQQQSVEGTLSAASSNQIGRCASCSSHQNLCARPVGVGAVHPAGSANNNSNNNHHHHHQLMHQPASHPALLHTICCHEQHNDNNCEATTSGRASLRSLEQNDCSKAGSCNQLSGGHQPATVACNQATGMCLRQSSAVELVSEQPAARRQPIPAGLKLVPRFLAATSTVAFLDSQHPALQLTCSLQSRPQMRSRDFMRSQTVRDQSGQLWLCMSNGYVSHIALIEFVVSDCEPVHHSADGDGGNQLRSDEPPSSRRFNLIPVVKSGGDVCKSRINCAAQVSWPSRAGTISSGKSFSLDLAGQATRATTESQARDVLAHSEGDSNPRPAPPPQPPPEVSIKSASPPMNILGESRRSCVQLEDEEPKFPPERQMSHSAPAVGLTETPNQPVDVRMSSSSSTGPEEASAGGQQKQVTRERPACHKAPTAEQHRSGAHHHHQRCAPSSTACSQPASRLGRPPAANHHHHHHHYYHGGTQHHHHHHHHHQYHSQYNTRHHTVSLAELRRAHERQIRSAKCDHFQRHQRHHLAPPANTPATSNNNNNNINNVQPHSQTNRSGSFEQVRSCTPPLRNVSASTKTKQLRHQASLKTSAILAKLVGSAGRASSNYLRRSGASGQGRGKSEEPARKLSDAEDQSGSARSEGQETGACLNQAESVQSISAPQQQQLNSLVSPLSSISSLNSSNSSSLAPVWPPGTPMHSSCTGLFEGPALQWGGPHSGACCVAELRAMAHQPRQASSSSSREDMEQVAESCLRSRSATVPSRAFCEPLRAGTAQNKQSPGGGGSGPALVMGPASGGQEETYRVNEILETGSSSCDQAERECGRGGATATTATTTAAAAAGGGGGGGGGAEHPREQTSLWLGCDDGSLLVIDCLTSGRSQQTSDGSTCCQQEFRCHNVHSELNLGSSISDIVNYDNERVFLALANGRLVVFYRQVATSGDDRAHQHEDRFGWQLERPQVVSVVQASETMDQTGTSKLCLVSEQRELWFSHGGRVFILDLDTLSPKASVAPPGGDDLNAGPPAEIDAMESVAQLGGVWVIFREPHCLIRFHQAGGQHKLMLETSLLQPVSQVLLCGNEIIRQHKTACLGATATLSLFDERDQSNSLLIGTSAGLILILTLNKEQLRDQADSNWSPQVISLRHGHSGHVKFLQLVKPERVQTAELADVSSSELVLVSGGAGFDLYGPNDGSQLATLQQQQHVDNLNHLVFWAI